MVEITMLTMLKLGFLHYATYIGVYTKEIILSQSYSNEIILIPKLEVLQLLRTGLQFHFHG